MPESQEFMHELIKLIERYRGRITFSEAIGMMEVAKNQLLIEVTARAEDSNEP